VLDLLGVGIGGQGRQLRIELLLGRHLVALRRTALQ
jgi:hypothetical protein